MGRAPGSLALDALRCGGALVRAVAADLPSLGKGTGECVWVGTINACVEGNGGACSFIQRLIVLLGSSKCFEGVMDGAVVARGHSEQQEYDLA